MSASRGYARLFDPRGIAVVGASADPRRIGAEPVRILQETGYRGTIYPVNPKYQELRGLRCYPDVAALPPPCDLAIVAVNAAAVPAVLRECGRAGIPYAIIFSAGFREIGASGAALEQELKSAARQAGVRVVGPNCIGLMNLNERVYCGFGAGFANPDLKAGPVALVSQSGGFAFSVVGLADAEGIGFNYVVSAGNEADLTTLDFIADFLEREDVAIVVSYMEGVSDGRRLRALGQRALELQKPLLVWKVGNSASGRVAAQSHTASMTADYAFYRAAFEEGGFIEIDDVHDLVDATRAFLGRRLPRGPGVAVITTSGGSGVLIADACEKRGLELPKLQPETVEKIAPLAPRYAAFGNPVDLTAQITGDHERVNEVCAHVLADPNIDQLIVRYGAVQGAKGEAWAKGLTAVAEATDKPLTIAWSRVRDGAEPSLQHLEAHRIPCLLTPTRAARAAGMLHEFARKRRRWLEHAGRAFMRPLARPALEFPARGGTLSEHESKQCLAAYGIPVTREIALSLPEIVSLKEPPLRFPVAVKVDSPGIAHKTEAGAVRLDVNSLSDLKRGAEEVLTAARNYRPEARIDRVLICEMVAGEEVIAGAVNDAFFGPLVMFGLGGVFAEVLKDVAYRYAPFDVQAAREMMAEIRGHALLTGYRGRPALAVDALAEALSRVSLLAADHADRIATLDVNPLFVSADKVVAADALIVLRPDTVT
ncbi:MAG: acetate--CoA ligase family protein [Betaproteobacteria bacterium]